MAILPNDPVLAFQAQLSRALKAYDREQERVLREVEKALEDYRRDVLSRFAGVTEWDAARVEGLLRANQAAAEAAREALTRQWIAAANEATTLALAGVEAPLAALGLPVNSIQAMAPLRELAILNDYVPTLIQGVTDEAHRQVKGLMQRALLGGIDTRDMVQQIGKVVGPLKPGERPEGTIFSRAEVRARTIMRTEMNRVHDLTTRARIDDLSGKFPGVGKQWIHRPSSNPRPDHAALHGKIVYPAEGETFTLAGMQVSGPHDPKLPAEHTVNCHCGLRVVYSKKIGAKGAAESPYIAGDGLGIPSAKGRPLPA